MAMSRQHSSSDGTSIKSVKEASSWSTYCAKASIVYLGTTISQEWGVGIRKTDEGARVVREVPAGAAQHAHEVAVSRSYGSARLRRRRRRRRRLGTCLTKHSCGRYLVHATARTDEWGPLGTERCAQNMGYSSAYRGTEIREENSDTATRVGALLACQCTNHSPFTPFNATLV